MWDGCEYRWPIPRRRPALNVNTGRYPAPHLGMRPEFDAVTEQTERDIRLPAADRQWSPPGLHCNLSDSALPSQPHCQQGDFAPLLRLVVHKNTPGSAWSLHFSFTSHFHTSTIRPERPHYLRTSHLLDRNPNFILRIQTLALALTQCNNLPARCIRGPGL